jgi:hypothetical protein
MKVDHWRVPVLTGFWLGFPDPWRSGSKAAANWMRLHEAHRITPAKSMVARSHPGELIGVSRYDRATARSWHARHRGGSVSAWTVRSFGDACAAGSDMNRFSKPTAQVTADRPAIGHRGKGAKLESGFCHPPAVGARPRQTGSNMTLVNFSA